MHADNDTDKNEYEEDLELKKAKDTNSNLGVIKQDMKSNFRIISVEDTIKNEGDNEPDTSDNGNTDANNVPRGNSKNLEDDEQENPNSETSKEYRAKNNQNLENLPNVLTDRSERGCKINTEDDTEEGDSK